MLHRQFGILAVAILLLSPTFVSARETDSDTELSVGNVHITKTSDGTTVKTSKMQISTPKTAESPWIAKRNRKRHRTPEIRSKRTYSPPAIIHQRVDPDDQVTTTTTPTSRTTIMRSSRNGSQSISEQTQSIQCSGSGTSVSQSSTTINGRTVNSEVRSNCR